MADQVGYTVNGGLDGFDDNYCEKWESAPGLTDLVNVMPEVKAAFNGIAKAACANGGKLLITGGAEKGCHAPGPYGHEGGWKLDVDPGSVNNACGRDTFLDLVAKYGAAAGDEGDHYDLAFNSQGGVGGTQVATPQKYLSDGGGSNASASPSSGGGGGGGGRGDSQYDGFRFKYMGETVQITKLPDKKTFCEPIYPDLIMVGDSVPKWALDAAAEVTNVTDDSMIQWGKNTGSSDEKTDEQHPEEETPLQKEYDKFAEDYNKHKDERFKAWQKANGGKGTKEEYEQAAKDHPEQFEAGLIYVGNDEAERKKAKELVTKELDYEDKLKKEAEQKKNQDSGGTSESGSSGSGSSGGSQSSGGSSADYTSRMQELTEKEQALTKEIEDKISQVLEAYFQSNQYEKPKEYNDSSYQDAMYHKFAKAWAEQNGYSGLTSSITDLENKRLAITKEAADLPVG